MARLMCGADGWYPPHQPHCLGCGPENPASLGIRMRPLGDRGVAGEVAFGSAHEGAPGFAHGGAVATALDDALGTLLMRLRTPAVTRRLEVDYLRPAFLERRYEAHCRMRVHGRPQAVDDRGATGRDRAGCQRQGAFRVRGGRALLAEREGRRSGSADPGRGAIVALVSAGRHPHEVGSPRRPERQRRARFPTFNCWVWLACLSQRRDPRSLSAARRGGSSRCVVVRRWGGSSEVAQPVVRELVLAVCDLKTLWHHRDRR